MTRPSGETNEPEPPLLKRTDDFCTCSSHLAGRLEAVLLLELLERRVVEQPHAFVGVDDRCRQDQQKCSCQKSERNGHLAFPLKESNWE